MLAIRLPEILSDGVIVLDGHRLSDTQAHWDGEDAEMTRRIPAPRRLTFEETRNAIQRWMAARAAGGPNFCYAIRTPEGLLAGGCEVRWLTAPNVLGISYWCDPLFRRRGFAGRAVALMLGAVSATGAKKIEAHIEADNIASRKVAEQAGFIEDGTVVEESGHGVVVRLRYVKTLQSSD